MSTTAPAVVTATKKEEPLPFVYQFVAGAIAGISELAVMYPLDVVKTRLLLQSNTVAAEEKYKGLVDCVSRIVKREGFKQLYKGISSPFLMEAPKRATKFAFNEKFKTIYTDLLGNERKQTVAIISGASAGAVEASVIVPFELVKVQMQDVTCKFDSPVGVLKDIIRKDGFLGIYQGLESTVWRHAFWNAGYFGVIFQVRNSLPPVQNNNEKIRNDLIAGTIGGTMGCVLNTPFDVVKSRIQSNGNITVLEDGSILKKYNWALPSVLKIYQEEGFRALYKGFVPKIARLGPGGGILLIVFSTITDFFKEMRAAN